MKKFFFIFFLLLFLFSCVKKDIQHYSVSDVMQKKWCEKAYSEDIVFLSDPFFAVSFMGKTALKYDRFYTLAQRYGKSSMLYVTVDNPGNFSFVDDVRLDMKLWKNNKELSGKLFLHATQARTLIVSPFFLLYSPLQAKNIYKRRSQCGRTVPRIIENTGLQRNKNFITINYSYAAVALAKDVVQQLEKLTGTNDISISPQLYIFTNKMDMYMQNVLQVFLRYFYLLAPYEKVNILHYEQIHNIDLFVKEQIEDRINIEENVVLLSVGVYTQKILKKLYNRKKDKKYIQNFFYVGGWNNMDTLRNRVPKDIQAHAWIESPLSAIFQDTLFVPAKIYRLK